VRGGEQLGSAKAGFLTQSVVGSSQGSAITHRSLGKERDIRVPPPPSHLVRERWTGIQTSLIAFNNRQILQLCDLFRGARVKTESTSAAEAWSVSLLPPPTPRSHQQTGAQARGGLRLYTHGLHVVIT
jgi:hypothetical protein